VFRGERLTVSGVGKQDIIIKQVGEREVGRVASIAVNQNKPCLRPNSYALGDFGDVHAFPNVVELAPSRNIVKIGLESSLGQRHELVVVPLRLCLDEPEDTKFPPLRIDSGRVTVCQNGEFIGEILTGRKPALRIHVLRPTGIGPAELPNTRFGVVFHTRKWRTSGIDLALLHDLLRG